VVELDRHIACWVTKVIDTYSEYVILIVFSSVTVVRRMCLNVMCIA